jgi:hypothetical protein
MGDSDGIEEMKVAYFAPEGKPFFPWVIGDTGLRLAIVKCFSQELDNSETNSMSQQKFGTVAVVLALDLGKERWVDTLSDERELLTLENAVTEGEEFPLELVYAFRERQQSEDEVFGDYVEELLSQPFVRPEVRDHGVAWLKSRLKIEQYRTQEREAAQVIAEFALQKYWQNPKLEDFQLTGEGVQVRVRIVRLKKVLRKTA